MIDPSIEQQYNAEANLQRSRSEMEQNQNASLMLQAQRENQAALVEQINPSRMLREIRLTLEGKEEDDYGNIMKSGERLLNEKGVGKMMLLAKCLINQNTIMSSLEDKEIGKLVIQVGDDIADDLAMSWKEYGIKDKGDFDIIMDVIIIPGFLALKRAKGGGERRFLGTTTVENISSIPRMPMAQKKTFLEKFKL